MATTSLPSKSTSPFHSNTLSLPSAHTHFIKPSFFNPLDHCPCTRKPSVQLHAKKKNPWLDPFDDGEDPDMEYGSLYADGKQEENPRLPDNPDNPYGFLKFPMGFAVEVASLPLKIRGDVRRCCCVISGGVYENLLFFPEAKMPKLHSKPTSCPFDSFKITSHFEQLCNQESGLARVAGSSFDSTCIMNK